MNLIFDFDGTICDSIKTSVDVVNKIFSKLGYKKTNFKEVRKIGLKGIVVTRKISPLKINKIISYYRLGIKNNYDSMVPFKDIKSTLSKLSKNNVLGILTTNKIGVVNKFLDKNRLNFFKFVNSEEDVFRKDNGLKKIIKKYNLVRSQTYYIGDETRDIEAAKKQKINSIAVTWGAESKVSLEKSKPDKIITKPKDLLTL